MTERSPGGVMPGDQLISHDTLPEGETPESNKQRFQIELEFVQCLANPNYLHYLALNGYLDDEVFLAYLKYLLYWKDPMYAKYIIYPHCLTFLEMLQSPAFCRDLKDPNCVEMIHRQQFFHWQYHRYKRGEQQQQQPQQQQQQQQPVAVSTPDAQAMPASFPDMGNLPAGSGAPSM